MATEFPGGGGWGGGWGLNPVMNEVKYYRVQRAVLRRDVAKSTKAFLQKGAAPESTPASKMTGYSTGAVSRTATGNTAAPDGER